MNALKCSLRLTPVRQLAAQQVRTTYIVKRRRTPYIGAKWESPYIVGDYIKDVNPPPPVPEMINLYDHENVINTNELPKPPLKVILLEYVEDLGVAGDILEVESDKARWELLLPRRAVYASPYNLNYYKSLIENSEGNEGPSSATAMQTMKYLRNNFHKIVLSGERPWTVAPWHVRLALRENGIIVPEESIELPATPISGPEGTEGKAFIATVIINGRERAPTRFVICHTKTVIDPYWYTGRKDALLPEQNELLQSLPIVDPPPKEDDDYN